MKVAVRYLIVASMFFRSAIGLADQFHYNNVLMGDRAAGMGGAFTAIADDASAVIYNPAGLAFALSNDISGSANALYGREVTYKKAAFGKDFVEHSEGTMAPFFGALGKLDHISQGLVFAFGYATPDSELKDQDDLISPNEITRFHRTANVRASTNKFSLAVAKRFGGALAIGGGLAYLWTDELAQIYQDSRAARQGYSVDADGMRTADADGNAQARTDCCVRYLTQNIRERLQAKAIEPNIGVQYAFMEHFSVGFTIKKPILISQSYESGFERSTFYTDTSGNVLDVDETGVYDLAALGATSAKAYDPNRTEVGNEKEKNPLGDWPAEVRLGFAWFASTAAILTADVQYYTEAKGDSPQYEREAVMNYAVGTEYYITPSFPIRAGLFTNNDAREKPKDGKTNQLDSIDYTGLSLYFAFVQPNSQIALGGVVQQGTGKSQKVAGSTEIQEVEAFAWTAGFSVSHNF